MNPTWVVQSNLSNSKDHNIIKSVCEKNNYPFYSVKIIPFSPDLPEIPSENPTIFYGATNFINNVYQSNRWKPGTFFNTETNTIRACVEHYKEHMLNYPCEFTTIGKFVSSAHRSSGDQIFVRPDKDLKEFAGDVFDFNKLVKWEKALRYMPGCGIDNNPNLTIDTEIVVADPVGIAHEWRLFIVDGNVSSGSHYRSYRKLEISKDLPDRVVTFAEEMCKIWMPSAVFVMDIAESAGNLYVVECNCFNSSGFYDSDIEKIITDISEKIKRSNF